MTVIVNAKAHVLEVGPETVPSVVTILMMGVVLWSVRLTNMVTLELGSAYPVIQLVCNINSTKCE